MSGHETEEHLPDVHDFSLIEGCERRNAADRVVAVIRHDLAEGDQQECAAGKSRIHKVLSESAEETFCNENAEYRSGYRNIQRTLRRKAQREQKARYDGGTVPQCVRSLCNIVKYKFCQHRSNNTCENDKCSMQSEMPDTEYCSRKKTDDDIHHNAAGRQRISQMR